MNKRLELVQQELDRQTLLYGTQMHDPNFWYVILGEEVGEVARAIYDMKSKKVGSVANYRDELIQVAAVAVAMLESFERQHGNITE